MKKKIIIKKKYPLIMRKPSSPKIELHPIFKQGPPFETYKPERTSKEIIDACWGKNVEVPIAPFLTEEALMQVAPTKFFTPVKIEFKLPPNSWMNSYQKSISDGVTIPNFDDPKPYDCFNKFEPGYGNNIRDFMDQFNNAMDLLLKPLPPKEKDAEEKAYELGLADGRSEAYQEVLDKLLKVEKETIPVSGEY